MVFCVLDQIGIHHHNENDLRIIKLEHFQVYQCQVMFSIVTGYFMILKNELSPPILGAQADRGLLMTS